MRSLCHQQSATVLGCIANRITQVFHEFLGDFLRVARVYRPAKNLPFIPELPPAHEEEEWTQCQMVSRAHGIIGLEVPEQPISERCCDLLRQDQRAGCVGAFRERFSLSGWVMSIPYPFCLKWLKSNSSPLSSVN